MKVYFGTSPRIKLKYSEDVHRIYNLLKKLDYRHTSDFVEKVDPEAFYRLPEENPSLSFKEAISSIKEAEICVFEASLHSLSVGYLINYSLELGKPVIVLTQRDETDYLFKGIKSDSFFFIHYNADDLEKKLEKALEEARSRIDIRFNFFITPKLLSYLDWVASERRIPRSVYLRNLIDRELKADEAYIKENQP